MDEYRTGCVTIDGNIFFTIKFNFVDFVKFMEKQNHMKTISNSLFSQFDSKKTGMITFEDMISAMVKGAKKEDLEKMLGWVGLKTSAAQLENNADIAISPFPRMQTQNYDTFENNKGTFGTHITGNKLSFPHNNKLQTRALTLMTKIHRSLH